MIEILENAKQDIAPQWVKLSNNVREQVADCLDRKADEDSVIALARKVLTLCDHVDQLHRDLSGLLGALEGSATDSGKKEPDEREIDFAAVEEQRETHDTRSTPLDILKALLMWRDDPAERVRGKG